MNKKEIAEVVVLEYNKQSFMEFSGMKTANTKKYIDSKGKTHEVGSENKDSARSWGICSLLFVLANTCGSLCKCSQNLSETEFQISELIWLVK